MSIVVGKRPVATQTEEFISDILCNRCGKSCMVNGLYEKMEAYASWGYYSHKDTDKWSAQLCEECADAFKQWVEEAGGKIDIRECY